jgi:hypothetical protein
MRGRGDREEKCTMRLFLSTKFSMDVRNVCGNMSWVPEMRQWSTCARLLQTQPCECGLLGGCVNREETHTHTSLRGVCSPACAPARQRPDWVEQLESARDARGVYPPRCASRLFIRASMLSRTVSRSSNLMVASRQP